jgi:hypothetical protein
MPEAHHLIVEAVYCLVVRGDTVMPKMPHEHAPQSSPYRDNRGNGAVVARYAFN